MKLIFSILLLIFNLNAFADTLDLSKYFVNKSACFILYDNNQQKIIQKFGDERCTKRIPADSTFKIPLSVMAFDQNLIQENTVFKWDKKERWLSQWNKNQTPKSWLTYSVVWVSQELTPKIGIEKIQKYLNDFHYGNQDFSGDPGKNNGLTHAWLDSSLKISAEEQLAFLQALANNALPVSKTAMENTKNNMYLETLSNGWKLSGKTGSNAKDENNLQDGWFVGYLTKKDQTLIFVVNFTDLQDPKTGEYGGPRAKTTLKKIVSDLHVA